MQIVERCSVAPVMHGRLAGKGTTHFFVAALPIYCLCILDVTPGYLNRLAESPRQ